MKILLLIISSIILLISTFNLTIKAQEIKSFISKEHQFSVDFPESPNIEENTLEGATKAKAYLFNVEQATIVFSVLYINFESLDPKVTANKEAFVRFMGSQIVKTVNGQLLGAINTTFNDFSGRSLKISAENNYGLDEEAIKAAFLIKFVPGSKDGKPVHVRARLEFTFSLL